MRTFRLILFSLCIIGLVGVLGIIAFAPKPASLGQRTADYPMRPEILQSLRRAVHLADANDDAGALKMVDGASRFPNKTNPEVMEINQVRGFVFNQENRRKAEWASRLPARPHS